MFLQALSVLRPSSQANYFVEKFPDAQGARGKRLLVVTLREYHSQPERNSRLKDWAMFLTELDKRNYFPIVVRDTYTSFELAPDCLKSFCQFPQGAVDYQLRVALYQRAWLNMGVSTGPMYAISFLPNVASIVFQMISEDNPSNTRLSIRKIGLVEGEDYAFRDNNFQKLFWGEDSYENICRAFFSMLEEMGEVGDCYANVSKKK